MSQIHEKSIDTRAYAGEKSRRMQIEELINKFMPTLLIVEHDKAFVNQTGARVINI